MTNNISNQKHLTVLIQTLAKLIHHVNDQSFIKRSTEYPISRRQFEILKILTSSGPYTVTDLSMFLMISKPAASKSINTLVKLGLVERNIPPLDRRKVLVSILPGGEQIVNRYNEMLTTQGKRILKEFNKPELEIFEKSLNKYIKTLVEEYRHETDLLCLNCNSRFFENCPISDEGETLCYHAIVEATAEVADEH